MKIKSITVTPFSVPYKHVVKWAAGALTASDHLIVRIEAEDGTCGHAEAIPRPMIYGETQEGMYYALTKHLIPPLIGEDSLNLERIWEKMERLQWNPAAKGAIDVALWDLNARLLGVSAAQLLGGPYRTEVPVSWQIPLVSNEQAIAELKRLTGEGFICFKVKGGPDPDNDIALLKEMRAEAPNARLYIDANMDYGRQDAIRVMKALEGVIDSLEEPIRASDDAGRLDLASRTDIPILTDESSFTVEAVYHQLRLGAVREIGIKIPRTGFTKSRKIVHLAEAGNLPVQVCLQAECDYGAAACVQFAAAFRQISLPCEVACYLDCVADTIIKSPLVIKNGHTQLPEGPGLGVELDWDKIEKYRVNIG
ncbi:mandelate racemase/muconate lactonizing enzyme family protein [Rhodobium gokarnense]|uniref:L-alanine-DL-glutamate epimerase-like enolase superfamily enzyme n=1 Tax=Rhodobium gokarnense TaxID=364296 RepID=A0ABT3H7J8_9HYPH|nr:mandelate racemase/muconate lactonizing enzyme family protein [Rhodobium gokarnense]MCW2306349.1 L-alanine-DL-glutamate epimerase-like enolase superfamily enzyme [Rhodobium gokarnense]